MQKKRGINLRSKELNVDDLQAILYWYSKAFNDSKDEDQDTYKKTLIKIQALAVYAQEDAEWHDKFFKRLR